MSNATQVIALAVNDLPAAGYIRLQRFAEKPTPANFGQERWHPTAACLLAVKADNRYDCTKDLMSAALAAAIEIEPAVHAVSVSGDNWTVSLKIDGTYRSHVNGETVIDTVISK